MSLLGAEFDKAVKELPDRWLAYCEKCNEEPPLLSRHEGHGATKVRTK